MTNSPLILVVDDQAEFREIFSVELAAKGYKVATAASGEEGLTMARELHPAIMLLDVQMPGMNGVETLLKLKEDPALADIKVVFLTNLGNGDTDSRLINDLTARDIHAEGYIKKTEDMGTLLEDIKRHLN